MNKGEETYENPKNFLDRLKVLFEELGLKCEFRSLYPHSSGESLRGARLGLFVYFTSGQKDNRGCLFSAWIPPLLEKLTWVFNFAHDTNNIEYKQFKDKIYFLLEESGFYRRLQAQQAV